MPSQYCTPADLLNTINPLALTGISNGAQVQACVDASNEADSYMRGRYNLPIASPYDPAIVRHTAYIAVYLLLAARGYNPSQGGDGTVETNYYKAVGNPMIAGSGFFPGIVESVATIGSPTQLPQVRTSPQRGWTRCGVGGVR
jgi:hypothetical protein